jgi:hypothetical protein
VNRINTAGTIRLDSDEAEDLADTLSFVDAWLRAASDQTLEDLADYITEGNQHGGAREVADGFIIRVGMHVVVLRQRIKQVSR